MLGQREEFSFIGIGVRVLSFSLSFFFLDNKNERLNYFSCIFVILGGVNLYMFDLLQMWNCYVHFNSLQNFIPRRYIFLRVFLNVLSLCKLYLKKKKREYNRVRKLMINLTIKWENCADTQWKEKNSGTRSKLYDIATRFGFETIACILQLSIVSS